MAGISHFVTYGYMISDALHVEKAVRKHLALLKGHGLADSELKQFGGTIVDAKGFVTLDSSGQTPLEASRQDLKDRLGDYRSAAKNVVVTFAGIDAAAEKDLSMKGSFPSTDATLISYVDAVAPHLETYAARLTARKFPRKQQEELVASGTRFKAAFAARGLERGEARAATLGREGVFKKLQTEITYLRTLGHEALRGSNARKDFDRVKVDKAPTPKQKAAIAAKKAKAAAKKAAKKTAALAKKQGRKQPPPATSAA